MDDKTALLSQLRDIHLPPPSSGWQLAPGWYALFTLSVLILLTIIYRVWCRYRRDAVKREALRLLIAYEENYQQTKDVQCFSRQISELLRRVALVYFSRELVAGLYGNEWLMFLNKHGKKIDFSSVKDYLLHLPYQSIKTETASDNDRQIKAFYDCARAWIAQRRPDV